MKINTENDATNLQVKQKQKLEWSCLPLDAESKQTNPDAFYYL